MFQFSAPPLALYIHIPWCVRKCPYCDFNSHEAHGSIPEMDYIRALIADLEQDLPRVAGRTVQSIFIGGGTPSLLAAEAVDRLLSEIRKRLPLAEDAEITLEANPGMVEVRKFEEFRAAGINRLSIGVQSFDDDSLQRLGRIHNRREAVAAAEAARAAGFGNFNLDLMYGLPGQSITQAMADIRTTVDLEPSHISHYQLTIEPNTLFHRYAPALPDEDLSWEMQQLCQKALKERGYMQYEVSAYARSGRMCRHNLNYWQFGDYLGIGAGAHGKITDPAIGAITRLWKLRQPSDYLRNAHLPNRIGGVSELRPPDAVLEFMMNALRLVDGFPERLFTERTGLPVTAMAVPLQTALEKGLVERYDESVRPTELGQRFLNELLGLFLIEEDTDNRKGRA